MASMPRVAGISKAFAGADGDVASGRPSAGSAKQLDKNTWLQDPQGCNYYVAGGPRWHNSQQFQLHSSGDA